MPLYFIMVPFSFIEEALYTGLSPLNGADLVSRVEYRLWKSRFYHNKLLDDHETITFRAYATLSIVNKMIPMLVA